MCFHSLSTFPRCSLCLVPRLGPGQTDAADISPAHRSSLCAGSGVKMCLQATPGGSTKAGLRAEGLLIEGGVGLALVFFGWGLKDSYVEEIQVCQSGWRASQVEGTCRRVPRQEITGKLV